MVTIPAMSSGGPKFDPWSHQFSKFLKKCFVTSSRLVFFLNFFLPFYITSWLIFLYGEQFSFIRSHAVARLGTPESLGKSSTPSPPSTHPYQEVIHRLSLCTAALIPFLIYPKKINRTLFAAFGLHRAKHLGPHKKQPRVRGGGGFHPHPHRITLCP
jgi:hypothetical protein